MVMCQGHFSSVEGMAEFAKILFMRAVESLGRGKSLIRSRQWTCGPRLRGRRRAAGGPLAAVS